jgi:hypothetical protein
MPALIPVLPAMVWQTPANLSQESKVFCPICVANGYSSSVRKPKDWFFSVNNVGAALWYTSIPRTQVGLTFHGSSRAIRPIITYQPVTETTNTPALNVSYGLQSQETGSTGAAVTLEKKLLPSKSGDQRFWWRCTTHVRNLQPDCVRSQNRVQGSVGAGAPV